MHPQQFTLQRTISARIATFLILVSFVSIALPTPARALTCLAPDYKKTVDEGGAVFIGTVQNVTEVGQANEYGSSQVILQVTFDVQKAWSTNQISKTFTLKQYAPVITGEDMWGMGTRFQTGTRYVVLVTKQNGEFRASAGACGGSEAYTGTEAEYTNLMVGRNLGSGYIPAPAQTPTPTPNEDTGLIRQLQEQISLLLAQIAALQARIPTTPTPLPGNTCPLLYRNLQIGSRGEDVTGLQRYLVTQGHLAADGATGFYGTMTRDAVRTLQSHHGIASSGDESSTGWGAIGPRTRTFLAQCQRIPR